MLVDLSDYEDDDPPVGRLFAVSDVHTDHRDNMAWCDSLASRGDFSSDALILAGDVSSDERTVRRTLEACTAAFGKVFFTPGNHDLWIKPSNPPRADSLQKLHALQRLCDEMGVLTRPALAAGATRAAPSAPDCPRGRQQRVSGTSHAQARSSARSSRTTTSHGTSSPT